MEDLGQLSHSLHSEVRFYVRLVASLGNIVGLVASHLTSWELEGGKRLVLHAVTVVEGLTCLGRPR